jgi:multicomponent Na+:H+ antiporter subunit F
MLTSIANIVLLVLAMAALLVFVRLIKGPSLPDRVVAMDLLGTLTVSILVVGAAAAGERAFLDAAIIIALIAFVSNIAYARFIERKGQ